MILMHFLEAVAELMKLKICCAAFVKWRSLISYLLKHTTGLVNFRAKVRVCCSQEGSRL